MTKSQALTPRSSLKQEPLDPFGRPGPAPREGQKLLRSIGATVNDPDAAAAVQRLRDLIFFHPSDRARGGKTIGLAGPRGQEGTTSLSILLGLSLAELKRNRVVFIDGRLDRKSFRLYSDMFALQKNALDYNNGCGYFQCYSAREQNLCFLLPGGAVESLEFFSNEEMAHLLGDLREAFDYVIFDMPPVLKSSETRMLFPHLDLFFLVCAARRTEVSDVEKVKTIVADLGGSIRGVVLNRQKTPFWTSLFGKDAFF